MSQNYIVTLDTKDKKAEPIVTISNKCFEYTDIPQGIMLISAGTVTFVKTQFGAIEADVVHGRLILGIGIDLNQLSLDKKLIEELFL